MKVLFIEHNIPPQCREPLMGPPASTRDSTQTKSLSPELCVTRKIQGGRVREKAGVRHPDRLTSSPMDQTASQMVNIRLLSGHTSNRLNRISEDRR